MLPYLLLMITLRYPDEEELQVSAASMLPDGFTVRLSKEQRNDRPKRMECYFLKMREKRYTKIFISDFSYTLSGETDYYTEYSVVSKQADFKTALNRSMQDYLDYVRLHEQDEYLMMRELTGFVFDDESYPKGKSDWKMSMTTGTARYNEALLPAEIAVCLDGPALWHKFLESDKRSFLQFYWKDNGLEDHPVHIYPVTHVYIGNAYCSFLMPDEEILIRLLNHALTCKLTPVVVFSTMPVRLEQRNESILHTLGCWCIEQHQTLELVLNDIGMARQIQMMEKENRLPQGVFRLTAGTLLAKRKKDFRMKYLADDNTLAQEYGETSIDAAFYRAYLRDKFGFSHISYETCGYPFSVIGSENILHLPLYQMNTSGYCIMQALCSTGDRGRQSPMTHCPYYCEKHAILFPEGLPAIGAWNSLFGCDMQVLNDARILNDLIRSGISRLVIRL